MSLRKILHYPNPRLRIKAAPVVDFNEALHSLIKDMFETMYEANGIGLAATQIDEHHCVVVMDLSNERDQPEVFINPAILETSGRRKMEEGCLSVPGIYESVTRPVYVKFKAQDEKGNWFEREANDDLLAACIQHEVDHLNGKVFVDYLSSFKQGRVKKKLKELAKETL